MNSSVMFTVEEMNLMCIFPTATKSILIEAIRTIQPKIKDKELTAVISSTLLKLNGLSEKAFNEIKFIPADETGAGE